SAGSSRSTRCSRARRTRCSTTSAARTPRIPAAAPQAAKGPGPFYWIVSVKTGKVVMSYNETKDVGAAMVQAVQGNLGAQHWKVNGSGTARQLENRNSHLCLAATGYNGLVRQYSCGTLDGSITWHASNYDDMWAGNPITWSSYFVGQCLEAYGSTFRTADCNGTTAQQFRLSYVPGT
uniref:RICIN domain-containing protein n=1 Tax=Actinomadura fibrosa TaxID=111802 RepID=UPI0013F14971